MTFRMKTTLAACLALLVLSSAYASSNYLGVESCASSLCHGAKSAQDNRQVAQNEYTTWFRFDKHSRSIQTLRSPAAMNITRTLGQPSPWENQSCLACHSSHVANDRQASTFSNDDGISCEACHGPAENWVGTHHLGTKGAQQPLPLWQPEQQASICLSCHSPSTDKPMSHRLFAAGHPPLSFEMVAFSQLQPTHTVYDDDYVQRKTKPVELLRWFTGQVIATKNYLSRLEKHIPLSGEIVPDGALFNCYSCHQEASRPQSSSSANPGALQPDNSAINMISIAANAANWSHAAQLDQAIAHWMASASESKTEFVAATVGLWQQIKVLKEDAAFADRLRQPEMKVLLSDELKTRVVDGQFKYWGNAEQAYYLLGITDPRVSLEGLLKSLGQRDNFDSQAFQAEFAELKSNGD